MGEPVTIRIARIQDAPALLDIYAPYVKTTAVTFEYDVPSPEEFAHRINTTLQSYPCLTASINEETAGYAYAGPLRERAAYGRSAEASVYIKQGLQKMGIGKRLYHALEQVLALQNITNLYACIASTEDKNDPYLTNGSLLFHRRLGYRHAGTFSRCGFKFGRWYDVVWMEKHLLPHTVPPAAVKPLSKKQKNLDTLPLSL